jgi:glycosyltransferase involved in cell wall biosynthesis
MTRRLLFAHDDRIQFDANGRPVSYNYSRDLIDRYRHLADTVTFAVRCPEASPILWYSDTRIQCIPEMKRGLSFVRMRAADMRVRELVSGHDVVVARLPSLIGSWALRAALRTNTPVLVEFVGCPWDALWNHSLKGKAVAPYFWLKNRFLMRRVSHAIYVTDRFLQHRYPTRGDWVSCSDVEVRLAKDTLMERKLRLQNLPDKQPVVLGTIANLDVRYKGQELVIRALASLGAGSQNFVYRLIGPGNPARLSALAKDLGVSDCIEFLGGIDHGRIPDVLDQIDVYLQPSRQEGLPRAMIEAMARGCVVIGARTGGIPELLAEEWTVPRGDWRSIAAMLADLGDRDLVAAAMENHATASRFELKSLNEKRFRFYKKFLSDHGLSPAHSQGGQGA